MLKFFLPVFAILLANLTPAFSQVSISPQFIFTDDHSPFGSLVFTNETNAIQEIDLNFRFGYPKTDSSGNTIMEYDDPDAEQRYSAAGWITAYPRVFSLEPGEQQTIRLAVRPPSGIPDGRYWARVVTGSKAVPAASGGGSGARLNVRIEQITGFFFSKGNVRSGVVFHGLSAQTSNNMLEIKAPVTRSGNAPFLGNMRIDIYDESGNKVVSEISRSTVYIGALRTFEMDISSLQAGEYTAKVSFIPDRRDIAPEHLSDYSSASMSTTFTVE